MNAQPPRKIAWIVVSAVLLMFSAGSVHAAVLTLSIQTDDASTWQLFGQLDSPGEHEGIAGIGVDVWGTGGAEVTSSLLELPRGFSGTRFVPFGFGLFPADGANGMGIGGAQDTLSGTQYVLPNIGLEGGQEPDLSAGGAPDIWTVPVLIASGTYSGQGTQGALLHADLSPGSPLVLLPDGYVGGATAGVEGLSLAAEKNVGGGGVGTPPENANAGGNKGAGDWAGPPGWNNPARTIDLAGSATPTDGDPITYNWVITNPRGGTLDKAGQSLTVSIGELPGELPNPGDPDDWFLFGVTMIASDKDGDSAPADALLYVPEPGTMLLLGLGCVGALLRRRRH
jgi:hypothetical protein